MVIAKSERARLNLIEQLATRELHREYVTVVNGVMVSGGTVDAPIGRHPKDRKRMAVVSRGKPAVSHYRVRERFRAHTLVTVKLETGRTHQIRAHATYAGHPLAGDKKYGDKQFNQALKSLGLNRLFLHANRLSLPLVTDIVIDAPLPDDLSQILSKLGPVNTN